MRIAGLVIAAIGLVLVVFALTGADAPIEQASQFVTGQYADATMWYLIAGIAAIVGGGLLAAFGPRRI